MQASGYGTLSLSGHGAELGSGLFIEETSALGSRSMVAMRQPISVSLCPFRKARQSALYGTRSLSGHADGASASSDGVGASMVMRCPRSIQNAQPAASAATTAMSTLDTIPEPSRVAVDKTVLRMQPKRPQRVGQQRNRQDREYPDQVERNPPRHTFRKQRCEKA